MLSQDIFKMGMRTAIIEHGDDSPAGLMTKQSWGTGWNDEEALAAFIETSDIITLENEFIDPEILTRIAEKDPSFLCLKPLHLCKTSSHKSKPCKKQE